MREITVRIWSEKDKYNDYVLNINESDTLLSIIQELNTKDKVNIRDEHLYSWVERDPRESDINNTVLKLFSESFYIDKKEFERKVGLEFNIKDNQYGSDVVNKLEAAEILRGKNVKFCVGLVSGSIHFEYSINPLKDLGKISYPNNNISLDFNFLICNHQLSMKEKLTLNLVTSKDPKNSFINFNYLKSNKTPSDQPIQKLMELEREDKSMIKFCCFKFPPKISGEINLQQILDYFPMKSNVAAIMYPAIPELVGSSQNMRINKEFSGNVLNEHITAYINKYNFAGLLKDDKDFDKNNFLSMIVEFVPNKSFVHFVIVPNGTVYIAHNRYMRYTMSGSMRCLTELAGNMFKDLKVFSDIFYEFETGASSVFQDNKVHVLDYKTYHLCKLVFNAKNDKITWKNSASHVQELLDKSRLFKVLDNSTTTKTYSRKKVTKTKLDVIYTPVNSIDDEMKFVSNYINFEKFTNLYKGDEDLNTKYVKMDDEVLRSSPYKYFVIDFDHDDKDHVTELNFNIESENIIGNYNSIVFISNLLYALRHKSIKRSVQNTSDVIEKNAKKIKEDNKVNANKRKTLPEEGVRDNKNRRVTKEMYDVKEKKKDNTNVVKKKENKKRKADTEKEADKNEIIKKTSKRQEVEEQNAALLEQLFLEGGERSCVDNSGQNDELSNLRQADPKLFMWKVNNESIKENLNRTTNKNSARSQFEEAKMKEGELRDYNVICQKPVKVIDSSEFNKNFKNMYGLRTGSDKNKCEDNVYICPRYWCPTSRVSVSEAQKCPNGENKEDRGEFVNPYFLKPSAHPRGLILPCCGKKPKANIGTILESPLCGKNLALNYNKVTDDVIKDKFQDKSVFSLIDPNIESAFQSAFKFDLNPIELILKKMTIQDFLILNGGDNIRSFYDPDIKIENVKKQFNDFLNEDDTKKFMRAFEVGKLNMDSEQLMFMIFNSIGNFKEYLRSDVRKVFEDFVGFVNFSWFSKDTGLLFFTKDKQNVKQIYFNYDKSIISSRFEKYCCFYSQDDGYITPIYSNNSGNLATLKTDILKQIVDNKKDPVKNYIHTNINREDPEQYVLDYNLRICGFISKDANNIFIPFTEHFKIMPNTKYKFISSLKLKDKKATTTLYNKFGIKYVTEGNDIYLPDIDYLYSNKEDKPTTVFNLFNPVNQNPICAINNIDNVKKTLNDLYYLRHPLNPMSLGDKIKYLKSQNISEDLARCMLQVYDIDGLFERTLKIGMNGKTKKINYDPDESDFAKIMAKYQNPYMNMFANIDEVSNSLGSLVL